MRTTIEKINTTAQEALKFEKYVEDLMTRSEVFVRSIDRSQGPAGFSICFDVEGDREEIRKLAA